MSRTLSLRIQWADNAKRYGMASLPGLAQSHRRSSSQSVPTLETLHQPGDIPGMVRAATTPNLDPDVFPPPRSHRPDPSIFLPYIPEDIAFEEEYEEYLSDIGVSPDKDESLFSPTQSALSAWQRLSSLGNEIADGISDSESMASIGDLGDEAKFDGSSGDKDMLDENLNNWEHMSPKTMAALPKSPVGHGRRSSSGSSLRPVLPFDLDDGSAVDDEDEDDTPEMGPMPKEQTGPFAAGEGGKGVDEVEYLYGE